MNTRNCSLYQALGLSLVATLFVGSSPCYGERLSLFDLPLEELINTPISSASYFEENILSSAYSVNYSDEQKWRKLGVRNVGELLNHMPSSVAPSALGRPRVLATRGYFRPSSLSGTAVRFDGIPMNKLRQSSGLFEIDGYDLTTLQTIEVIRGPGSATHGNDAFHGVISLQSLAPETDKTTLLTDLESDEGGATTLSTRHSFGNQRITGALAARNLGDAKIEYPYLDPVSDAIKTGHRSNKRENANALFKYQYDNNDSSFYLTNYYLDFSADQLPGPGQTLPGQSLKDKDWSLFESNTTITKIGFNRQLSTNSEFKSFAYYWSNDDEFSVDGRYQNSPQPVKLFEKRAEDSRGVQLVFAHQFSQQNNLALAYEYRENRLMNVQVEVTDVFDVVTSNGKAPESGFSRRVNSLIIDGKQTFPRWDTTLVYGLRMDDYSDFSDQFSPRLGLIQALNKQSQLKLIYSHAFRAPSAYEYFGSEFVAPNTKLEPEELDNIELVYQYYKSKWFHSITLFTSRWRDAIDQQLIPQTVDGKLARWENRGKSKAEGIELESSYQSYKLTLDAWASYIKSEEVGKNDDNAFPHVMIYIGFGYRLVEQWEVYVSNRYQRREKATVVATSEGAKDYFRTDVSINWHGSEKLSAGLAVRNMLDRENYQPSIFDHLQGIPENSINASLYVNYIL